jgi:hypothetical protein
MVNFSSTKFFFIKMQEVDQLNYDVHHYYFRFAKKSYYFKVLYTMFICRYLQKSCKLHCYVFDYDF